MVQILAIGEVLWDVFPDGPRFGGAPANFACACSRLGGSGVQVALASAVGRDELGVAAEEQLRRAGVGTQFLARLDRPTGQVFVELGSDGQPRYRFAEHPAWDEIPDSEELATLCLTADVVCFGTLAQRGEPSRQTIQRLLRNVARPGQLRVLDLNLRAPYWTEEIISQSLPLANVMKLNDEELPILASTLGLSGSEENVLANVLERYALRLIALTRGAEGSTLFTASGERSDRAGIRVDVVDTVGAGDAFTAALTMGLTHSLPLDRLHRWAGEVAEYVCTRPGGTPEFPKQLTHSHVMNP